MSNLQISTLPLIKSQKKEIRNTYKKLKRGDRLRGLQLDGEKILILLKGLQCEVNSVGSE
jgi:hypothetical protein